ncbi:enoyl-CoA hydratase/isomerase family protein [Jatrophihabitans sp.]|uniref:enoyl-CoA hydratase/isomerase family protein n=1 Tax=Jatrophihabitans sp. TaxID=1932789 RepID=UPI002C713579|nr:enoyl-CoA hydratase/isomerase family protein [Jatrophihabitans sp.]
MPDNAEPAVLRVASGPGTAVLQLNRPAVRNALNAALVDRLAAVLAELDDDPDVRAVVLTGSPPGFCAGSDLTELAGLPVAERTRHEARAGYLARRLQQLSIPVLAAVEGFALGGGFLLATSCDIVVSAGQARWQLPEVGLGWVPPWGLQSLLARVGPATARRLAWGEQALSGQQLHRLGAVDEISEPGGALQRAVDLAARLAALPPHAVASTKRAFADAGSAEGLDARTVEMFGLDCSSTTAQLSFARFARPLRDPAR